MAVTIKSQFAGTDYHLRITEEVEARLGTPTGSDVTELVPVTYVDPEDPEDDMEDEVDLAWLLCVMKAFKHVRAVLDHPETDVDARAVVMELAKKLMPNAGGPGEDIPAELQAANAADREALLDAFGGVEPGAYGVPMDGLFENIEYNPEAVEFALSLGFAGQDLSYPIPPPNHRYVAALVNATLPVVLDADDTALIPDSSLAPADIAVLRTLLTCAADDGTSFVAALARRLALPTPSLDFLGHLLYSLADDVPDSVSDALFSSDALYAYLTQRDVKRDHRTVCDMERQRVVTYDSLLARVAKELLPTWPPARTAAFKAVLRAKWAAAPPVNTGVLTDPVQEAMEEYFLPEAEAAADADAGGDDLPSQFDRAAKAAAKLKKLSNDDKLALYGHYKQATAGDCTKPKPGLFDFEGKAKWQAWIQVKGMEQDAAMAKYVELVQAHLAAA
eukprot:TRINITY_DN12911_c0_g1_i1.p1 TRINITY_DN12911_c0_g1~~TRINITY_DN12911_c0_g1_i1.p1  ORF type:complete len:468 (+),score=182.74 TRINITY_DN12911_c0_g1_i1:64-1404(+)